MVNNVENLLKCHPTSTPTLGFCSIDDKALNDLNPNKILEKGVCRGKKQKKNFVGG